MRWPSGVTKIRQRAVVGSPARDRGGEVDAGGADVVREDVAELIVGDLADERAFPAERGDPGDGVRRRSARDFAARAHLGIERIGFLGREHQLHRALGDADFLDEAVLGLGENVDDGIADGDDVIGGAGQVWAPIGLRGRPRARQSIAQ